MKQLPLLQYLTHCAARLQSLALLPRCLMAAARRHQRVIRFGLTIPCLAVLPGRSAFAAPSAANDCLIQAARAQSELPRNAWSRLLLVRYPGRGLGHVYAIYELPGHRVFAYDAIFGSRRIHPRSLYTSDVTRAADIRALNGKYLEDTYGGPALSR